MVYTTKGDAKNRVYKPCLVTKGYSQIQGIDCSETFSPTARMESVRTLVQFSCSGRLVITPDGCERCLPSCTY